MYLAIAYISVFISIKSLMDINQLQRDDCSSSSSCSSSRVVVVVVVVVCTDLSGNVSHRQVGVGTVCLLFYVLATSKVISGWAATCNSAH